MNPTVLAFENLGKPPTDGKPMFLPDMLFAEVESYIGNAPEIFKEHGAPPDIDIPPVILLGGIGGIIAIACEDGLTNDAAKDAMVANIREAVTVMPFIHSIALITASYITKIAREEGEKLLKHGGTLAGAEGYERTEAVTAMVELRNGVTKIGYANVTRFDDAPPQFAAVDWTVPETAGGRFNNFFPTPSATRN